MSSRLSIGELARQAGLNPSAIRYYESVGVLPIPERRNGRRRYDPDTHYVLHAVEIAKQAGFTMAEMRTLFSSGERNEAPSLVWERLAHKKLQEVDQLIARAEAMKALLEEGLRCGCLTMEECKVLGARPSAS
jgi:MerR family redox-sensitive transcriptional activator SoxR